MDILDSLKDIQNLQSFLSLIIKVPEISSLLKKSGPYTLFAPLDQAILNTRLERFESNSDQLTQILKLHIAPNFMTTLDLTQIKQINTLEGECLTVMMEDNNVLINNAKILNDNKDIVCTNGIIQVIDRLLVP